MNTKHPYAELLHAIADGKEIQCLNKETNTWEESILSNDDLLFSIYDRAINKEFIWRVKPPYILINGIEVTEPCREPLNKNERYWMLDLMGSTKLASEDTWYGTSFDFECLDRGLIHRTKEAAETHAKALLSFTSGIKG